MKCFAQNTKQITHSSHASYPSISLPVSKVLILGIKLSSRDPAATEYYRDETPYHGLSRIISETVWSSKAFSLAGYTTR